MEIGSLLDGVNDALDSGIDVELRHPTKNMLLGITIRTASYESDKARAYNRKIINDRQKNPSFRASAEEVEIASRNFQVAMTLGWTWGEMPNPEGVMEPVTIDGSQWDFTPQNVEKFYRRFPLLAQQVDRVASDASRFLPPSA